MAVMRSMRLAICGWTTLIVVLRGMMLLITLTLLMQGWFLVRFDVENVHVLARHMNKQPSETWCGNMFFGGLVTNNQSATMPDSRLEGHFQHANPDVEIASYHFILHSLGSARGPLNVFTICCA